MRKFNRFIRKNLAGSIQWVGGRKFSGTWCEGGWTTRDTLVNAFPGQCRPIAKMHCWLKLLVSQQQVIINYKTSCKHRLGQNKYYDSSCHISKYVGGFISCYGLRDAILTSHTLTTCTALIGSLPGKSAKLATFFGPYVKDAACFFSVANLSRGMRAAGNKATSGGSVKLTLPLFLTDITSLSPSFLLPSRWLGPYLSYYL